MYSLIFFIYSVVTGITAIVTVFDSCRCSVFSDYNYLFCSFYPSISCVHISFRCRIVFHYSIISCMNRIISGFNTLVIITVSVFNRSAVFSYYYSFSRSSNPLISAVHICSCIRIVYHHSITIFVYLIVTGISSFIVTIFISERCSVFSDYHCFFGSRYPHIFFTVNCNSFIFSVYLI